MQLSSIKIISNLVTSVFFFGTFLFGLGVSLTIGWYLFIFVYYYMNLTYGDPKATFFPNLWTLAPIIVPGIVILYMVRVIVYTEDKRQFGLLLQSNRLQQLEKLVRQVAKDLNVPGPQQIYLLPIPQAGAYELPRLTSSKRMLLIGWPLIRTLSQSELKAIIAHELAHFDNQAFILHHTVWRINSSIDKVRYISRSKDIMFIPVTMFLNVFLFLYGLATRRIQYSFELYCDSRGAQEYGSNTFAEALKKGMKLQISFGDYIQRFSKTSVQKITPQFFDEYLAHHSFLEGTKTLDNVLAQSMHVNYPEHPSLARRQEAIRRFSKQNDASTPIVISDKEMYTIEQEILGLL